MQKFKWDKDHLDLSLLDEDFLIALQKQTNREVFARIATLDINENPIEYIQGRVTDGSITVDGNSAVRRTCSLSLVAENVDINDVYWGLKTKFKLEVGLKNNLTGEYAVSKKQPNYPEIIWFPQGVFVITAFNTAISTKGYTISISGKDKMILLNGEVGGSLFASIDFGEEEVKEIKLTEVTGKIESSSSLLTRTHYYEVSPEDIDDLGENGWYGSEETNKYIPSENSLKYIFIQNEEGEFFKLNDRYWAISNSVYGGYMFINNLNQWVRPVQVKRSSEMSTGFRPIGYTNPYNKPLSEAEAASIEIGGEGRYYFYTLDDDEYQDKLDTNYYATHSAGNYFFQNDNTWYHLDISSYPLPWAEDGAHVLIPTRIQSGEEVQAKYKVQYYQLYKGPRYKAYKALETPSELFIPLTGDEMKRENYEAGVYYFSRKYSNEEEDNYFELNKTTEFKNQATYTNYRIKTFYSWNYEYSKKKVPLAKIIREGLHAHGGEPYQNIIINDLDDYALEQLTYKGDTPLYAFRDKDTGHFVTLAMDAQIVDQNYYKLEGSSVCTLTTPSSGNYEERQFTRESTIDNSTFVFDELSALAPSALANEVQWLTYVGSDLVERTYTIAKIEYGDDIGYRVTNLTYTGDLIAGIGESLTSVFDKIKNMLGEFEYFYDIEGRFVFQKKRTYVNTNWSQLTKTDDDLWVDYGNTDHRRISFSFEDSKLFTAINNSPNLTNLKNDFIVWGKRKTVDGNEYPIHARYAIDKKPREYLALDGTLYYTEEAKLFPIADTEEKIGSSYVPGDPRNLNNYPQVLVEVVNGVKTSDWWELNDWAEYYATITGAYPAQQFRTYATEPFIHSAITFDDRTTKAFSGGGQLMIDFKRSKLPGSYPLYSTTYTNLTTGQKTRRSWDPFQHSYRGCGHWYSQYKGFYASYDDMVTYIYKPQIPSAEVVAQDGGEIKVLADDVKLVDWRELIYQMATDYFAAQGSEENPIYNGYTGALVLNSPDKFLQAVGERNPYYYPTGYTGYEQYYTDIQGFWRQLYDPYYVPRVKYTEGYYTDNYVKPEGSIYNEKRKIWHDEAVEDVIIDYYVSNQNPDVVKVLDLLAEKYFNTSFSEFSRALASANSSIYRDLKKLPVEEQQIILNAYKYYVDMTDSSVAGLEKQQCVYWNRKVFEDTASLTFWLEFLDDVNELAQFSVKAVGDRTKVVNEDKVKAIVYKEIPDIILFSTFANEENGQPGWEFSELKYLQGAVGDMSGYSHVFLPSGFEQYFSISTQSASAKNKIDELLYQFGYCIENITITSLPIYQLQPNTRIYVRDDKTSINGEYIVSKFTIPLKHSGTMSITATKAPERLY